MNLICSEHCLIQCTRSNYSTGTNNSDSDGDREAGGLVGCGASCVNRYVQIECDESICSILQIGGKCLNRRMQNSKRPKVEVRFAGERGLGLFPCETVHKDDLILEYGASHICTYVCTTSMCLCIYVSMYLCIFVSMYPCIFASMYPCIHVFLGH
jgi:hypothetical protein